MSDDSKNLFVELQGPPIGHGVADGVVLSGWAELEEAARDRGLVLGIVLDGKAQLGTFGEHADVTIWTVSASLMPKPPPKMTLGTLSSPAAEVMDVGTEPTAPFAEVRIVDNCSGDRFHAQRLALAMLREYLKSWNLFT